MNRYPFQGKEKLIFVVLEINLMINNRPNTAIGNLSRFDFL
jgi:hypothetical protein